MKLATMAEGSDWEASIEAAVAEALSAENDPKTAMDLALSFASAEFQKMLQRVRQAAGASLLADHTAPGGAHERNSSIPGSCPIRSVSFCFPGCDQALTQAAPQPGPATDSHLHPGMPHRAEGAGLDEPDFPLMPDSCRI